MVTRFRGENGIQHLTVASPLEKVLEPSFPNQTSFSIACWDIIQNLCTLLFFAMYKRLAKTIPHFEKELALMSAIFQPYFHAKFNKKPK